MGIARLHQPFQPFQLVAVGREFEVGVEAGSRLYNAPLVAESLETRTAVISPHAAVAYAAEGQVAVGRLEYRVVDAGAARRGVLYHVAGTFATLGKIVEGERFFPLVHILHAVVDVVERNHGEDRPENFVGEQGRLRVYIGEQRRGDIAVGRVVKSSAEGRAVRKEGGQPFEMAVVDDAGIVGAELRVFAVLPQDFIRYLFNERLLYAAVNHQVVGGDARLSAVEEFAPYDPLCRRRQVGIVVDDTRAFPAQFEGHGGKVLCGRLHNVLSVLDAAGVEYVVEPFLQQLFGCLPPDIGHGDIFLFETFADEFLQDFGRAGCFARRFHDGAVPRGDGAHQRRQGQLQRIVPRSDNEHTAVRLVMDAAFGTKEEHGGRTPPVAGPALQVIFERAYLVQEEPGFGGITLERRLPQVGAQRFGQLAFAGGNAFGEPVEGAQPERNLAGDVFVEKCFLQIYHVVTVVCSHIVDFMVKIVSDCL